MLVNKSVPVPSGNIGPVGSSNVQTEYRNAEVHYKSLVPAYVEKVMISTNTVDSLLVKLLLRQTRKPEIGDKFSSRHGQKGVIGMIIIFFAQNIRTLFKKDVLIFLIMIF